MHQFPELLRSAFCKSVLGYQGALKSPNIFAPVRALDSRPAIGLRATALRTILCSRGLAVLSLLFHSLIDVVIRGQRQEFCEVVVSRNPVEERPRSSKLVPARLLYLSDFVIQNAAKHFVRHFSAIIEHAALIANPLPDLRPRNFCRRGVFH